NLATFFRYPTIAALADYLEKGPAAQGSLHTQARARLDLHRGSGGVAIIGMAGRFPGAANVEELWRNLCAGTECVTFFEDAELHPSVPAELRHNPAYVKARGILHDVDRF